MCNQFAFHHQFGTDTWRSKFEQQTGRYPFCLWIPWTRIIKILIPIDLNAPRHAWYMHKAWKKHQNTVYWVDINLSLEKGLKFYQTRSNAIILHENTSSLLYSGKLLGWRLEKSYTRKYTCHHRPPPKISLKQ